MRDKWMAGLTAYAVAFPIALLCCGGGALLLSASIGAIGGWFSGLSGVALLVAAGFSAVLFKELKKRRAASGNQKRMKTNE